MRGWEMPLAFQRRAAGQSANRHEPSLIRLVRDRYLMNVAQKSLITPSAVAFSVWLLAFVPTALAIRGVMKQAKSLGDHPWLALLALAMATSLVCLITIVVTLAEFRFFVRISIILLGLAGITAIQSPGLRLPAWRISEFLLGGVLTVGILFCALLVLRIMRFRIVSSPRQAGLTGSQYPLLDLFILATAVALALAAVRLSGAGWHSANLKYYFHLGGLGACFAVNSLLALAVVLGRGGWSWVIVAVLLAPIGYLPATTASHMTLFPPWWSGALTLSHTCLVAVLLLMFRVYGFRVTRLETLASMDT